VFIELMPLLAGRTVLITVAKVDDKTLRVNVPLWQKLTRTRLATNPKSIEAHHARQRRDALFSTVIWNHATLIYVQA
jgi:hypothetical protein